MKTKIFIMKKKRKKNGAEIWKLLLLNLYCEIVLQGMLKVKEIVLQYSHCIAEKKA